MKAIFEKKEQFSLIAKHVTNFIGSAPMFHSHCELIHVIKGSIEMTVDGVHHILKEGETCIVFPYCIHQYEDAPQTEAYLFLFDSSKFSGLNTFFDSHKPILPFTSEMIFFAPVFDRIVELYNQNEFIPNQTALAYTKALLGELLSILVLQDAKEDSANMIKQILTYCATHFSDEDISIQKIADALYISTSYVSKIFNQKLHYSFREYINILRIHHARDLLSDTHYKIIDIMLECGFKNQSSFNRIFQNISGISPKEYRKINCKKTLHLE